MADPAPRIAIVAPGDMGHGVGRRLVERGAHVVTSLAGRSPRSAKRAEAAGMAVAADDRDLTRVDLFLSIVPPGQAVALAERVAAALARDPVPLTYVDCNAVSPATMDRIAGIVTKAGAGCVDVAIIGAPPKGDAGPRFYASGPAVAAAAVLGRYGLDYRPIGDAIGRASALKMSYAAITKGLTALATEALTAARLGGVAEALTAELAASQPDLAAWFARAVPAMSPKAYRWVAEMHEIAATQRALGLPGGMLAGAAAMYELITASPLGGEQIEARTGGETPEAVAAALAAFVARP